MEVQWIPSLKKNEEECSICVEKKRDEAHVHACGHSFCFMCIHKWVKIRNICPLCNTPPSRIIHNVSPDNCYDVFDIQTGVSMSVRDWLRSEITEDFFQKYMDHRHFPLLSKVLLQINRNEHPKELRKIIYREEVWMKPLVDKQEFNDFMFGLLMRNEIEVKRAEPWLRRELKVLLEDRKHLIDKAFHTIVMLSREHLILGDAFTQVLYPYFGCQTQHFQFEFFCFYISGLQVHEYDTKVWDTCNLTIEDLQKLNGTVVKFNINNPPEILSLEQTMTPFVFLWGAYGPPQ